MGVLVRVAESAWAESVSRQCAARRDAFARGEVWSASVRGPVGAREVLCPVLGKDGVMRCSCSVCGRKAPWTQQWSWFGSRPDVERGAWERVLMACSPACREAAEVQVGSVVRWKWPCPLLLLHVG